MKYYFISYRSGPKLSCKVINQHPIDWFMAFKRIMEKREEDPTKDIPVTLLSWQPISRREYKKYRSYGVL